MNFVTVVIFCSVFLSTPALEAVTNIQEGTKQQGNASVVAESKCTNVYNYFDAGCSKNMETLIHEVRTQLDDLREKIANLERKKKGSKENPGISCTDIRNSGDFTTRGNYWIRPKEALDSFQAYCDMSAIGQWKKVTRDQIDSTLTGGVTLTYGEENNGLTISVGVDLNGCGSTPDPGALTFIKGYWKKIKYTQEFNGVTSCWSIFGDQWYGRSSVNHASAGVYRFSRADGDVITNQHYMGGSSDTFDGDVKRCDNDNRKNFWRKPRPSARRATVVLRRKLDAEKAGIFTGTSCGKPTYKISEIFVYY